MLHIVTRALLDAMAAARFVRGQLIMFAVYIIFYFLLSLMLYCYFEQ